MKNALSILVLLLSSIGVLAQCPSINFSYVVAPIPCQAKTRISITLVSGGAAPYTYQLNTGNFQSSKTFIVTQSGGYTLTVKDKNGCTASQSIATIGVIPKLNATVTKTNPTCNGIPNGSATANPSNGVPPYSYQWKQGATVIGTGQSIGGLGAGAYKLVVKDAQNCSKTVSFSITSPGSMILISQGVTIANTNPPLLYSVKLFSPTGTPPKMFRACAPDGTDCSAWQNGVGAGGNTAFVFVYAGAYQFQVKDANNCIATLTLTVPLPPAQNRSEIPDIRPTVAEPLIFPNPNDGSFTLALPASVSPTGIRVFDVAGRQILEQALPANSEQPVQISLEHLPSGVYMLEVMATNGEKCPMQKFVKQ